MNCSVRVCDRVIGTGHPCFIIAEAGSNHNGDLLQAQRLIDVAAAAGADAVKFQLFRAEKLYPKTAGKSDYLRLDQSIYDIIARMEMPYAWLPELAAYCERKKILFMASVFDEESADRLDPYVEVYKIASYEMTHVPLVRHIANKGKPVILATGAAELEEVKEAVEGFYRSGNRELALMQCTAAYPAPLSALNVRAVSTLREVFRVPTGLSDHSRDPLVGPMAAVAMGAHLLEKHFTLSNHLPGPDHPFAVEPNELVLLVESVRRVEQSLGSGEKVPQMVESELRDFARRYLFASCTIKKGEPLTESNVSILRKGKRPAGLPPKDWERVRGCAATRDIESEEPIGSGDVSWKS